MRPGNRRQFLWAAIGMGGSLGWAMLLSGRNGSDPRSAAKIPAGSDTHAVRKTTWAMGADVSITVLANKAEAAERAIDSALAELQVIDRLMSLYRSDSQLCQLNRQGVVRKPHPYLVDILRQSVAMSQRTQGAFDVTVQPLWALYAEAARSGDLPTPAAIEATRNRVDWRRVQISDSEIRLTAPDMAVTLNGIAQGFAADRVVDALRRQGIRHALVDTGEIAALGHKDREKPWMAGIQHPRCQDAYLTLACLRGRCLSTSGDYATTFSPDRTYHHLLDPRTGKSPQPLASVSVVASSALQADAMSTAVFLLGPEQGLELVRATGGADALLVLKDGRTLSTAGFPEGNLQDESIPQEEQAT